MIRPVVVVYGVLLSMARVASYLSGTAKTDGAGGQDEVVVLDIEREDLEQVRYESDALAVTIIPRSDDAGEYLWVTTDRVVTKPHPKKADPHRKPVPDGPDTDGADAGAASPADAPDAPDVDTDASAVAEPAEPAEPDGAAGTGGEAAKATPKPKPDRESPEPPEPIEEQELKSFKGGASAEKLVELVAPLRAKRVLDAVPEDQLGELGLAEPSARLIIVHGGKQRGFELGDTVFGGDSRYVRDTENGRVYLLDARVLRPLASAHHSMIDRELFRLRAPDIVSVEVEADGQSITLEHRNRADANAAYWGAAQSDTEHATGGAWINKALRLRARDFLPEEDTPAGAKMILVFTVRGEGEDGLVRVELRRGTGESGDEAWYARSDHTRGWVQVYKSQASQLAADVGTLFGDAPMVQEREDDPQEPTSPPSRPSVHP